MTNNILLYYFLFIFSGGVVIVYFIKMYIYMYGMIVAVSATWSARYMGPVLSGLLFSFGWLESMMYGDPMAKCFSNFSMPIL
jgi:hypothetical protein